MKVMTVLGTRPEIIRLSRVIPRLDEECEHVLVHTGQNYATELSGIFFEELGVRQADHWLGARADTFGAQIGQILALGEQVIKKEAPERLLILGDTNSGLIAIVAKRLGIPVFHMEAGNRCYDDRVPEEVNRRVIDHSSSVLLPYTYRSKENLVQEGLRRERIFVTGNPIFEVITSYQDVIAESDVLDRLGLSPGDYFLVTMHRAENVDVESRLRAMVSALEGLGERYGMPIVCSLHPRTWSKMQAFGLDEQSNHVRYLRPLGFLDFIALEKRARCVLTDSGTVQEECCILRVPNVTLRDVTERPETLECGSNVLAGVEPDRVLSSVETVLRRPADWTPPPEYLAPNVASVVTRLVLGYDWLLEDRLGS